jgi:hypothetical protein
MFSIVLAGVAGVLIAGMPTVMAHHAFGGEFAANRPLLLKGKVIKVELVNPHAWIHIAAAEVTLAGEKKDLKGQTEEWAVEGGTPNTLLRRGITRDSLSGNPEVVVDGYQTRDHSLMRANGRNITFTDGRKLFMGSSGTGAPKDGADSTEPPSSRRTTRRVAEEFAEPRRHEITKAGFTVDFVSSRLRGSFS